jgi:hypothetical protein
LCKFYQSFSIYHIFLFILRVAWVFSSRVMRRENTQDSLPALTAVRQAAGRDPQNIK